MVFLPKQPIIINKKDNWAVFEIENLYPGYGVTIGNSMRRVLLSSLAGAAITEVKISGVQHEFSTSDGILEDTINIMMNLKQMRFKMFSDEPQKATLKIKGERKIKASDFDFPTQVELINKDCHIATITDKKKELEMEIKIEKGIGYVPIERKKRPEKMEIGVMPVDAIFTPIKRVSFKVENMRVGERTDFDRLTLEIETDGTITPENAFSQASEILVNHFTLIADTFKEKIPLSGNGEKEAEKSEEKTEDKGEDTAKTKVEEMKLSTKTINVLLKGNIKTAAGLAKRTEASILEIEGMGEAGVKEIKSALKKLGLALKE